MSRVATIDRETKETKIEIELNLDGSYSRTSHARTSSYPHAGDARPLLRSSTSPWRRRGTTTTTSWRTWPSCWGSALKQALADAPRSASPRPGAHGRRPGGVTAGHNRPAVRGHRLPGPAVPPLHALLRHVLWHHLAHHRRSAASTTTTSWRPASRPWDRPCARPSRRGSACSAPRTGQDRGGCRCSPSASSPAWTSRRGRSSRGSSS